MATPRNAATGKFSAMRMPRTERRKHHALAVQIDDAQALVGRLVGGSKTHGQRERVEPLHAARPGSDPAGFHSTPRN